MAGHGAFRLLRSARDARFAERPDRCRGKRWPTSLVQGGVYAAVCAGFKSYAVRPFFAVWR